MEFYTLNGKEVKGCNSMDEYIELQKGKSNSLFRNEIGEVLVSTVFLGLNHRYGEGVPVLFETMIFGGEHDQYQDRYCTYDEAEAGHKKALGMAFPQLNTHA